ncbi:methyltransferase domain-containing protein [Kitasatospora sp. NPDC006697]|uniref:methyltransferase domain-containing protein n=1 Tax=Kitasatospora sp. NPDC006697 TaxID=3364020 RepID=UPI0036784A9F
MPEHHATPQDYWSTFRPTSDRPSAHRMNWTQYPDHGPSAEFLGHPATALEIGSATCVAGVALARTGVAVTCVDFSSHQMARARDWWAEEPHLTLLEADVIDFLSAAHTRWDCVFSNWGAAFFIDPDILLPLVRTHLTPGGLFAFSAVEPLAPCYGPQILYGNGYRGPRLAVVRWMLSDAQWSESLHRHGFHTIEVQTLPGPEPDLVGTVLGRARA